MLSAIHLQNFGKYTDKKIDFMPGLNLITGPNWSGKSTVLIGILYALFGAKKVPGQIKTLKTSKAKGKLNVTLGFNIEGESYRLERGTGVARLSRLEGREDKLVATGQNEVTTAVEKLLGLSADSFATFRTSMQEQAGALLDLGPAGMGRFINEISGVDLVDRVIESAKGKHTEVSGRLMGLPSSEDLPDLERQKDAAGNTLVSVAKERAKLGEAKHEAHKAYALAFESNQDIQSRYREQEKLLKLDASLKGQLVEAESLVNTLQERLGKAGGEDPTEARKKLIKQERTVSEILVLKDSCAQTKATVEQGREVIRTSSDTLEKLAPKKGVGPKAMEKAYESARSSLASAAAELRSLERIKKEAYCVACKRPFEDGAPADIDDRIESAKGLVDRIEEDVTRLRTELDEHRATKQEENALLELVSSWEVWLRDAEPELKKQKKKLVELEKGAPSAESLEDFRKAVHAMEQAWQAKSQVENQLLAARTRVDRVKKQLPEIQEGAKLTEEDLNESEKKVLELFEKTKEIDTNFARICLIENTAKSEVERTSKEFELAARAADEARKYRKRSALLSELIAYLRKNRDRFMQQTWKALLDYSSQMIQAATHGDVTKLTRTPEGKFTYLEGKTKMPLERASGMLRAIFGTSLKLSLSAAAGGHSAILLFDEITAAAEDSNSLLLTQLLRETGQQVILVTHRYADAAAADHVIEIGG